MLLLHVAMDHYHDTAIATYVYSYRNLYCLQFLGLPQHERNKLKNIHFICCSNKVGTLEMAEPIVDNLLKLEEGLPMYDALLGQQVLVVAPVMFIIADNPMASELCNHLGSAATKYCRICMVRHVAIGMKQDIARDIVLIINFTYIIH